MGYDYQVGIKESDNVYLNKIGISGTKPWCYRHKLMYGEYPLFKDKMMGLILKMFRYKKKRSDINKKHCIKLLEKQNFDVFEPTFFDSYFLPYLKNKPFVLTVHDMIPELFPEYFNRDDFQIVQKQKLCPLAAHIHVPSTRTKEDLVNILNVSPEKITVIPHGKPNYMANDFKSAPLFDFKYILYVGDRYGYKKFFSFLKEYSYIAKKFPEIKLVCTGRDFNYNEKTIISNLGIGENIITRFVSDETLINLYHYAIAFIYPSAYEGFGIPILEAFAAECPVILNNASCFPEVAGNAAIFFDINKDGNLFEKFENFYLSGESFRKEMIEKGRLQVEKYSWEKSAELLSNVYKSIV
jgi:glycosyltransferase involved in cell wall biosynthesis